MKKRFTVWIQKGNEVARQIPDESTIKLEVEKMKSAWRAHVRRAKLKKVKARTPQTFRFSALTKKRLKEIKKRPK